MNLPQVPRPVRGGAGFEKSFLDITSHISGDFPVTLEIEAGLTRQGFGSGYVSASSLFYHL